MVTDPARRRGHSLPELLVALALVGSSLSAVATAAILGAAWTRDAALAQAAVRAGAATLDSLLALPAAPDPGSAELASLPLVIEWSVSELPATHGAPGRLIDVTVRTVAGPAAPWSAARIAGVWFDPLPGLDP